ncbi:MAG: glycosyltransferase family 2 protein [Prevotellaceae bacterium]|jgi:hypothetical protein|nr:glycosyltransferase family 2 protein [Prevotellaceae bacterium]
MDDIFNIFNISWWMDESNHAPEIIDAIIFLLLLAPVAYLLVFTLASLTKQRLHTYPPAPVQCKFLVLYCVRRNGAEVIRSIEHFFDAQLYPREMYDIVVAASELPEEEFISLLEMPINIVVPDKENSSKVYSIRQVMERYSPNEYDMVLIFNSDNRIMPHALELFNNAYYSGCDAIQGHRMTENLTTPVAIFNAASEEISNNIFRKGHTTLNFSAALIGSAIALDFRIFHKLAPTLKGNDLSKTLEIALLRENIYIEYLDEVICYAKKEESYKEYEQRRNSWRKSRWNSAQYALIHLPVAFIRGNWDFCNKLVQWLMPSRFILMFLIMVMAACTTLLYWPLSFKWYALLLGYFFTILLAFPGGAIKSKFFNSFKDIPMLILRTLFTRKSKASAS